MVKISVVIRAYNCAATITEALNSVFRQAFAPSEILVLDDGSTDETSAILGSFRDRVTVLRQENAGAGVALNNLFRRASSDVIAVLDSDDVWHPQYLECQQQLYHRYPDAIALFTGHLTFEGRLDHCWSPIDVEAELNAELMQPLAFLEKYSVAPGHFGMSACCVSKHAVSRLADLPSQLKVAEDLYFLNRLAPFGPVVRTSAVVAGFRVRPDSLSSDRLELTRSEVTAFELLISGCDESSRDLLAFYKRTLASKRRLYAKILCGAGLMSEGRHQLRRSLIQASRPLSLAKSLILLGSTYLPSALHPAWPSSRREWNAASDGSKTSFQ